MVREIAADGSGYKTNLSGKGPKRPVVIINTGQLSVVFPLSVGGLSGCVKDPATSFSHLAGTCPVLCPDVIRGHNSRPDLGRIRLHLNEYKSNFFW